jgi:hypothetical protein
VAWDKFTQCRRTGMADDTDTPELETARRAAAMIPLELDWARGKRFGTGFIPRPVPKTDSRPQDYSPLERFAEEMGFETD